MTIQTVYCVDESKILPQHEKLLRTIRSLKGLTKGKIKTIDIATPPKTSDGSMYNNVYVKGSEEKLYLFVVVFLKYFLSVSELKGRRIC